MDKAKISSVLMSMLFLATGDLCADEILQVQPLKEKAKSSPQHWKKQWEHKPQLRTPTMNGADGSNDGPPPQDYNYPNGTSQAPSYQDQSYQEHSYQDPNMDSNSSLQSNLQSRMSNRYQQGQTIPADKPWYENVDPSLTNNNNNNGINSPPPINNSSGSGGYNP
jgi:hypothetical protein